MQTNSPDVPALFDPTTNVLLKALAEDRGWTPAEITKLDALLLEVQSPKADAQEYTVRSPAQSMATAVTWDTRKELRKELGVSPHSADSDLAMSAAIRSDFALFNIAFGPTLQTPHKGELRTIEKKWSKALKHAAESLYATSEHDGVCKLLPLLGSLGPIIATQDEAALDRALYDPHSTHAFTEIGRTLSLAWAKDDVQLFDELRRICRRMSRRGGEKPTQENPTHKPRQEPPITIKVRVIHQALKLCCELGRNPTRVEVEEGLKTSGFDLPLKASIWDKCHLTFLKGKPRGGNQRGTPQKSKPGRIYPKPSPR